MTNPERNGRPESKPPLLKSEVGYPAKRLSHQLAQVRKRQGISLRCAAKRLGITVSEAREQEDGSADLTLAQLYQWQAALDVPIGELLAEPADTLAAGVMDRARMLRIMKTALAIHNRSRTAAQQRLAQVLVDQLLELMPELKAVSGWPVVGQRRSAEELGKIVERPIPEQWFFEAT